MSTTWTFAQLVDTLKSQLEVLPEIIAFNPPVEIRVSMPHASEDISDWIILGIDADDTKEQNTLGGHSHDEEVTIGCGVSAVRYGSGETEAKAARDRAIAYLAIIDEELRTNAPEVGLQTLRMRVTNREYESFPSDAGPNSAPVRVARIFFDIDYRARTIP